MLSGTKSTLPHETFVQYADIERKVRRHGKTRILWRLCDLKTIGIIPARGGSKGVPLKNLRMLGGIPLVVRAARNALGAGCLDKVVVSTDHEDIARAALSTGAQVIMRPAELAADSSRTEDALLHVLGELESKEQMRFDAVLTLEPTAPFRSIETILRCSDALKDAQWDSAIAVVEGRARFGKIVASEFVFLSPGEKYLSRRQDREPLYRECGTIWGTRTGVLQSKKNVIGERPYALVVSEAEAVDINTEFDFVLAEAMFQAGSDGGI